MNAIELKNVTKHFPSFTLDNVSFAVPQGSVMGFIGENGAGKSTTIRLLLGLLSPDAGQTDLLGQGTAYDRERVGVVFDECPFPAQLSPRQFEQVLRRIYQTWSREKFFSLLERFELPLKTPIEKLSRGSRMKLSIAAALSHDSQVLLLDEATSGLDPVVRDEVLELFYDFMQDETHSILMSSHITSDLEKICDYITFIRKGKIVCSAEKDTLLATYGLLRCTPETYEALDPAAVHGVRRTEVSLNALVERARIPDGLPVDPITLDDLMVFYAKEDSAV